ncbi:MAG: thiamine-phosphate kinase [bacterium]|nr:thiamine-phosphate kinase [bacterium]
MRSGEFELIRKLTSSFSIKNKDVVVGVGDDCAVIKSSSSRYILATVDAQVAGVHFLPETPPERIGQKAVAVSISDIAAMGGTPKHCLVSLFLPKNIADNYVERVYRGITRECRAYSIDVVGGNITSAHQFAIDVALLGEVNPKNVLLRRGARVGDKVLVTGSLGNAGAGLYLLQNPRTQVPAAVRKLLVAKQNNPTPRVWESSIIAHARKATAMIDISDGLAQDMLHIAEQALVGVTLYENQLLVSREVKSFCKATGKNPSEFALAGGEDYELLFTAPPSHANALIRKVKKETGTAVTVIGEITKKEMGNWLILNNGRKKQLKPDGWNHLRV